MPTPARALAWQALRSASPTSPTLASFLNGPEADALSEADRSLLHELALGTLRRRGWLDHVLAPLADRPLGRIAAGVLDALRLGAYQLLFTRVPPHAALSESVELARAAEPRAAGFANAVLRRLQREGPPAEPDALQEPLAWLTSAGSLPSWLAGRWLARLGPTLAVARARALLSPPPTWFRLNPRAPEAEARLAAAGVQYQATAAPGALMLVAGRLSPFLADGTCYAMDEGSQLVALLAPASGLVLDACAAPGGKSLLIADRGGASVRVVACEASRRRTSTLRGLRDLWGAARVAPVRADTGRPPFRGNPFDCVLLDAPCSGLGTLARRPDIRWRTSSAELPRQAARQRRLIEALAGVVRPGGCLIYATCSVEPEENGDVIEDFLSHHSDYEMECPPASIRAGGTDPWLRMEPAETAGDAFFAAVLRRAGGHGTLGP